MEFGPVPLDRAKGAILAHSLVVAGKRLGKGRLLSDADVAALAREGFETVTVARPDPERDMGEDEAAAVIAAALAGAALGLRVSAPFTGRVNVYAEAPGLARIDAAAIDAVNAVHEAITIATLPDLARAAPRAMLATVKIIPYAAPRDAVEKVVALLTGASALTLAPFAMRRASVFLTRTPGMKDSVVTKGAEAVRLRLAGLGIEMAPPVTTPHETGALAEALTTGADGDMAVILGGSATADRRDVAPAAVVEAGGEVAHFGMPVDPGNLLFVGALDGRPVVGLPGCARSPKLNGADWVLARLAAGVPAGAAEIRAMGVGGLLKEIPSRPQPRDGAAAPSARPFVSALLLAAGASRRMQGSDKLMGEVDGAPLLTRTAKALIGAGVDEVVVVLPPDAAARRGALKGLKVRVVENLLAAEGMGASIRAGMAALDPGADAVLIALADMPDLTAAHHAALIAAFSPEDGREIVRAATAEGEPGNPVIFGRRFFEALRVLEGDEGARAILAANAAATTLAPLTERAALTDLDTPEDWTSWRDARARADD